MSDLIEREWTDKFGQHWEVSGRCKRGLVHRQKHTKQEHGWPDRESARSAVRASIVRSNAAPNTKDQDHG